MAQDKYDLLDGLIIAGAARKGYINTRMVLRDFELVDQSRELKEQKADVDRQYKEYMRKKDELEHAGRVEVKGNIRVGEAEKASKIKLLPRVTIDGKQYQQVQDT